MECGRLLSGIRRKPLRALPPLPIRVLLMPGAVLTSVEDFVSCVRSISVRLRLASALLRDLQVRVQAKMDGTPAWPIHLRDTASATFRLWDLMHCTTEAFAELNPPSAFPLVATTIRFTAMERFFAFRHLISIERHLGGSVGQAIVLGLLPLPLRGPSGSAALAGWPTVEEGGNIAGWTNSTRLDEWTVVLDSLKTSARSWDIPPQLVSSWQGFVNAADDAARCAGACETSN
jgi:hypothetical protein